MTKSESKEPEEMTTEELIERVHHLESRDTMWARQLASIWDSYRWIARRRDTLEGQLKAIRAQLGIEKGLDAITFDQITRNFLDLSTERDEYIQHLRSLLPDAEVLAAIESAAHNNKIMGHRAIKVREWLVKFDQPNTSISQYIGILPHDPNGPSSEDRVRRLRDGGDIDEAQTTD